MDDDLQTISAIAAGNPDFSILVTALDTAGLVETLDGEGDFTVFAPTNAAFAQLATDLGFEGDASDEDAVFGFIAGALSDLDPEGDPVPLLTEILLYHVSAEAKTALRIENSDTIETLVEAAAITPSAGRLVDLEPDLLDPEIVIADIAASNGTIQAIDRVLLPLDVPGNDAPTISDIAATTEGFAVLTAALEASGLDTVVGDPNAEFTVFAPTDAAFAALAVDLGFDGDESDPDAVFGFIAGALADLDPAGDPIPLLTDILLYHVSPGAQSVAELTAAESVATALDGARLVVNQDGTIFDADPDIANPGFAEGLTELAAANGTVQVIDRVLLPLDLANEAPEDTITDVVLSSGDGFDDTAGDFDILLAALVAAGLADALNDPSDDFTVFAPTDGAFLSLAAQLGGDASSEAAAFDSIVAALTDLSGEAEDPIPLLSSVLLYHVVDGSFTRAELAAGPELETLFGPAPQTDGDGLDDADPGFADPAFVDAASDIATANGLIQAIDEVLLPINIPDASDVLGDEGDNPLVVLTETRLVDGGPGTDSASFDAAVADTSFGFIEGGFTATTGGTTVELFNTESFVFTDETVLVSESEAAAQVFRAFGVGFGREGDIAGITAWTEVAETLGIAVVADAIVESPEFLDSFGGEVPVDDEIVSAFYGNFLGREGDAAGLAFWQGVIDSGAFDASDLLLAFSESTEFKERSENSFDDGVLLFA